MKLTVNGQAHEHKAAGTLKSLLDEMGADFKGVSVMVNDDVIKRSNIDSTILTEGDRVEVLNFVGGG